MRVQMEFYTKNGSDLCLIYGNESWNEGQVVWT